MFELTIRIAFSLLVVLGLMWGLAKLARKPLAGRGGGMLTVLARQQLTRGSAVAVVRVADRTLIVGVTDHRVSLLAEADLDTVEETRAEVAVRRHRVPVAPPTTEPQTASSGAVLTKVPSGGLNGSALSPRTWSQAIAFIRNRTVRR